ncbi:MAG: DUF5596 domain-containing protein [Planctomycetes bacterium]|nr:DUF5596 domain-containing protein [Planctomycetota bacterium]
MSQNESTWSDPVHAFAALGVPAPSDEQKKDWAETQKSWSEDASRQLLAAIAASLDAGIYKTEAGKVVADALSLLKQNKALERLAWHCHVQMSSAPWGGKCDIGQWPKLPDELGDGVRLFYALVFLSCVPAIRKFHKERGISDEVSLDTLADLELWTNEEKRLSGTWGFKQMGWLSNHFSGRLYKLGRLQFESHPYSYNFQAFRNKQDRRVVLFAGSGQKFRADGLFDGINGVHDPQAWTSAFTCDTQTLRGTPIDPKLGIARREPLSLKADEWTCVLSRHEPTLGVHIAATGPMDHAHCGESFRQACAFFPKHFPERPFRAFTCSSWLLDQYWEDYLAPDANIVRFLSEWYLYPYPYASDHQHIERIFDSKFDPKNLDANPQKSSVQKAFVQHMQAGKRWKMGASLLWPEDLDWGKQVYRKMPLFT